MTTRIRFSLQAFSILLVAILTASCGAARAGSSASNATTTTSPSSTTTLPRSSTTTTTQPLQSVDWTGVTVPPGVCPGLSQPVTLTASTVGTSTSGSATVPAPAGHQFGTPDVLIEESGVTYGELEPGESVAALSVWCSNTGGTADGQIQSSLVLYQWVSGRLTVLSTLTPQEQSSAGVHVPYFDASAGGTTISTGVITTKEVFYGPQDAVCCATGRATTIWAFDGHSFSPSTTVQVQPAGN